jgi:tyrosine-protein phosphatase YwqE
MGLFSFFKKTSEPIMLSKLGTDIHSHLLPGIDDGAQTLDHSIAMIQKFVDLGFKKLITTPHIMSDAYPNTPETINNALNEVRNELSRLQIPIEIEAAAEYYNDEFFFNLIDSEPLLTFMEKYVLFEFSFHQAPMHTNELIFKLQGKNYKPVLAHYERYNFYHSTKEAEEFREKGVLIQMNINSLTGHYGPKAQKIAESLVENKLVDVLGTDCHRIEHLMMMEKNLSKPYFHKMLDLDLLNFKRI